MPSPQSKCFTWTCHALNPIHGEHLESIQYSCFGIEVCPTTNKQHLQGYTQFRDKVTLTWYKKNICDKCHVEISRGDDASNKKYCSKEGKFVEFGERQFQGKRNDLKAICDKIKSRQPLISIITETPETYIRNYRGIKDALIALDPPRRRDVVHHTIGHIDCPPIPTSDIYYVYADSKPYPYHGQTNCRIYHGGVEGQSLISHIERGDPICIEGVPCMITSIWS